MSLARVLVPLAFLAQLAFVALYLSRENAIAFWDYAMYADLAIAQFTRGGFVSFAQSFAEKYNLLYALPSFITFWLFEPSRFVFILTNAFVFGAAYQLAAAALLRRAFGFDWPRALLWAMAACSLVPFLWYPLLQGYPDLGAAAALLFALALGCTPKQSVRQAIAFGACIGFAIVFRRHYAYAGLALLAAGALLDLPAWRSRAYWKHHAARALAAFAVIAVLEPVYLMEMLTANYGALYQSYERSPAYVGFFAAAHVGVVLFICGVLGWIAALRCSLMPRYSLFFILLSALLWLGLWSFGPAQAGQHYLIALLPAPFIVGLVALFVAQDHAARGWRSALAPLALGANVAYCLWLAPSFVLPSAPPTLSLFGTPRPPWVRQDGATLEALARHIAQTTTDEDRVAVSGSSFIFNQDLVRAVYTEQLKDFATAARFIPAPESDGDQPPPLHVYAAANVYLVASPPQFHLDPARQKHVAAFASLFPPPASLAPRFEKDEKVFTLEDGVSVSIWRRKKWTPEALYAGLNLIRRTSDTSVPWVFVAGGSQSQLTSKQRAGRDGVTTEALLLLSPLEPAAQLFFDTPLAEGTYALSSLVQADASCPPVRLRFALRAPMGKLLAEQTASLQGGTATPVFPFSLRESARAFLLIEIEKEGPAPCLLKLNNLYLSSQ